MVWLMLSLSNMSNGSAHFHLDASTVDSAIGAPGLEQRPYASRAKPLKLPLEPLFSHHTSYLKSCKSSNKGPNEPSSDAHG